MTKSLNQTYSILQSDFPIDITTRNLASNFFQNTLTCADYINPVVADQTTAATICAQNNFQNVTQLMPFVAGMWYGGDYLTALQTSTGMTPAETAAFFDTLDPTSFGSALSAMCDALSTKYSCVNSANCTNDELALL